MLVLKKLIQEIVGFEEMDTVNSVGFEEIGTRNSVDFEETGTRNSVGFEEMGTINSVGFEELRRRVQRHLWAGRFPASGIF